MKNSYSDLVLFFMSCSAKSSEKGLINLTAKSIAGSINGRGWMPLLYIALRIASTICSRVCSQRGLILQRIDQKQISEYYALLSTCTHIYVYIENNSKCLFSVFAPTNSHLIDHWSLSECMSSYYYVSHIYNCSRPSLCKNFSTFLHLILLD